MYLYHEMVTFMQIDTEASQRMVVQEITSCF